MEARSSRQVDLWGWNGPAVLHRVGKVGVLSHTLQDPGRSVMQDQDCKILNSLP
jgi:hypothetical protein